MRRLKTLSIALLFIVLLAGCATSSQSDATPDPSAAGAPVDTSTTDTSTGETRTIDHIMGSAEVTCKPERVVTLGQGATDALLALGMTPVGAVDPWGGEWYDYLGDRMADVPSVGAETEPNLEAIVSLQPDLIIGSQLRHEAIYDELQQIAPTVFAETIGKAWKENFQLYARALCREDEGAAVIEDWNQRIADFQEKMGDRLDTEVSLIRFRTAEVRIYTTGFPGSILREAGLSRPESQQVDDWENDPQVMTLSKEQIPLMDADIMFYFVSDWGNREGTVMHEEWTSHPLWQTLEVVQNDEVYPVNEQHWNLGGGILAANEMLDDLYGFFLPEESQEPDETQDSDVSEAGGAFPVSLEHKFGSTTIPDAPERILSLGYTDHDPILALGETPVAVRYWFGPEETQIWPWAQDELGEAEPEVLNMPFGELNFEAIAALAGDSFYGTLSGERIDLLDTDVLIWTVTPEQRATIEENPIYQQLEVAQEDRAIYLDTSGEGELTGPALVYSSVLSLPVVFEELVPQLAEAVGG